MSPITSPHFMGPEIHNALQSSSSLFLILRGIILIDILPSHVLKFHLNIVLSSPNFPNGLFPSGFLNKILYTYLTPPYVLYFCLSHPPWSDHSNSICPHNAGFSNLFPIVSIFFLAPFIQTYLIFP